MFVTDIVLCITSGHLSHYSQFHVNGRAKDRNLTVSVVKYPPFVTTVGLPPKGSDIDVVEALAARMDLSLNFLVTPTFEQLVNVVARGKADFTAAHPGLVVHRYAWGADIVGVDFRRFHFAQRHARPISSLYTMTHPYTGYAWTATVFTFLCVTLLLICLNQ